MFVFFTRCVVDGVWELDADPSRGRASASLFLAWPWAVGSCLNTSPGTENALAGDKCVA